MPGFRFIETNSFDANWEAFLVEMESIDADMARILRTNQAKLIAIVSQGARDARARADFNASIAAALDALLTPQGAEELP